MRLVRMGKRSRFYGAKCLHCHKPIKDGRVVMGTTLYVQHRDTAEATISMWSKTRRYARRKFVFPTDKDTFVEHEVRIAYHRTCIEKILRDGILDPEVERSMFEEYREQLAERFEDKGDPQ